MAPADRLLAAGAALALGTDSQIQINLLEDARLLARFLRAGRAPGRVRPLAPRQVLQAATAAGARSLGAPSGALEVGRPADFNTVRPLPTRRSPVRSPTRCSAPSCLRSSAGPFAKCGWGRAPVRGRWAPSYRSKLPKFYFDLRKALKSYEKNDTPWTPAVSLVIGVDAALEMLKAEGIENIWRRHERLATAIRAGVVALGLKLFSDFPSFAVTPVWLPEGMDWKVFNKTLKSKYGITIAGGQDDFAGKIFRISHLGYYDELDMVTMISALELTLKECGYTFELGAGVQAVLKSFAQ